EVAAFQVLFEGDRGIGMDHEAAVAGRALALGAGQGVFLAGVGMQEHGEVAADGAEAGGEHGVGGSADDDPVAVAGRQAQQPVAYCAADEVGVHGVYDACSLALGSWLFAFAPSPRLRGIAPFTGGRPGWGRAPKARGEVAASFVPPPNPPPQAGGGVDSAPFSSGAEG